MKDDSPPAGAGLLRRQLDGSESSRGALQGQGALSHRQVMYGKLMPAYDGSVQKIIFSIKI